MSIGKKIKQVAESKNISAQELGKCVGRTRQGIYDIYNARVSVSVDLLMKIAEALKEPIIKFLIDDYLKFPQIIPIEEILKHMKQVHEHARRGEGMVNLRIFRTKDGMYILESEFHELKDKLTEDEIEKFDRQIDESFRVCSP